LQVPTSSSNSTNHERLESSCRPTRQQSTVPASRRQHQQSDSQLATGSLTSAHCRYDHPVPRGQIICNVVPNLIQLGTHPYIADESEIIDYTFLTELAHLLTNLLHTVYIYIFFLYKLLIANMSRKNIIL